MRLLHHVLFPLICCLLPGGAVRAEILDKVVAVVGKNVITLSEVAQQLRLESFINQRPADNSAQARSLALRRLIDQSLVSQEMLVTSFLGASDEQIEQELAASRRQEFPNGDQFRRRAEGIQPLGRRPPGIFCGGSSICCGSSTFGFGRGWRYRRMKSIAITRTAIRPQVRLVEAGVPEPLTEVHGQIREIVAQQQVDALLDDWLKRVRASSRIDIAESGEFVDGSQVE